MRRPLRANRHWLSLFCPTLRRQRYSLHIVSSERRGDLVLFQILLTFSLLSLRFFFSPKAFYRNGRNSIRQFVLRPSRCLRYVVFEYDKDFFHGGRYARQRWSCNTATPPTVPNGIVVTLGKQTSWSAERGQSKILDRGNYFPPAFMRFRSSGPRIGSARRFLAKAASAKLKVTESRCSRFATIRSRDVSGFANNDLRNPRPL